MPLEREIELLDFYFEVIFSTACDENAVEVFNLHHLFIAETN